MQTQIDGMRNDIKVAVDERNRTQKKLLETTDNLKNSVAERQRLEKLKRRIGHPDPEVKEVSRLS